MTNPKAETDLAAWQQGVDLACDLLAEASWDTDEQALTPNVREGRPQNNVLYRYLLQLRDVRDARVDIAFAAVLTDFISSSLDGAIPDSEGLRRLAQKPIPQLPLEVQP